MAANSIDKSIFQAPQGIAALAETEADAPVLIVVEGDEEEAAEQGKEKADFYENLALRLDARDKQVLGSDLLTDIRDDLNARSDWEKMYKDGVKLLGLKIDDRTEPWQGACGVYHPIIAEAVIRFQADTVMETFPASGPVKTQIVGKETVENREAAQRVKDDMNWQLTENMVEFRPEHERMLWNLPGAGSAFKKVYFDDALGRQTSVFVDAADIVIPYGFTDMQTCPRIAHRFRKTIAEANRLQASEWWDGEVTISEMPAVQTNEVQQKKDKETGVSPINDKRPQFYEVLADLDLSVDKELKPAGVTLPYVVTVVDQSGDIVAIRRNWKEGDTLFKKRQHFVHYQYIPGYGAYGFGLFHLLGGFAKSATSIIRQLVDAGTLANLPGGLKTRGLRIKGDDTPIGPGEWRDVDLGSGGIKDNIMALPYKEPSATLYNLLGTIVEEGRRFAATADIKISEMSNQAPVGTTLALLERTLKVMSAVQARVHYSFKQELRLIAEIIKENADTPPTNEYAYNVEGPLGKRAKLSDYSMVEIVPVSDPNASTMSQRVVQWQAVQQLSTSAPEIYDLPELHRQMLHAFGIKDVQKLIPTAADIKPTDPVQENQNILASKPVKAFAHQDHEAHIQVHMAALTDPLMAQLIGQNPRAQQIGAAATAHIAEHVGFAYRNKMQAALGAPLPVGDQVLDEASEQRLSQALAQVAPQILQQSQKIVAQQQAKQNAQDPVLQAQLMEQQTKAREVDRKIAKDQADVALKEEELRIAAMKDGVDPASTATQNAIDVAAAQAKIAGEQKKTDEQIRLDREKFEHQQQMDRERLDTEKKRTNVQTAAQLDGQERDREKKDGVTDATLSMQAEKHAEEMRQKREQHKENIRMKREAHRANVEAKRAAAKAAAKAPKPSGDKK